jgi:oligopeptide transport system substrate-binding protein
MMKLAAIAVALLAVVGGTLAWSLGGSGTPADFTFVNRGDHKTLDPSMMAWLQDIRIAYALWEGLYRLDPRTLQPVPGVAYKVDIDPSGTVYTFHLRANARWTNGDPVTAQDFIFSWRRILRQPADYTSLHFYIKGAREYEQAYAAWVAQADTGQGRTAVPPPRYSMVGVKALDRRTLQVTLRNPTPFFLSLCAFPAFFPENQRSMRPFAHVDPKTGRVAYYDEDFTRPPHLVSDGPYRLDQWIFKRKLRLVASQYYWNKSAVRSKVIDEVSIEDPLAAFRAYLDGQVDWLSDVDEDLIGQMRRVGGYPDLHLFPGFGTYYYVLNCLPKLPDGSANPLADVRVRRALAMSVDKRPIVQDVLKAGEPIAERFIPPGIFPGYSSPPGLAYDPAEARRLMAEAGYPGGRGFPPLQIIYNQEMTEHADIALILRNEWQRNLGIHLNLQQLEIKVFAARLHSHDFAIARASWIGDYPDPTTFTDKFRSDNDDNEAGWSNPRYDALCNLAEKETRPAQRLRTLSQAEELLLQGAAVIPLYHYVNAYMFRSNVHGIALDPRDAVMLQGVWVSH